MAYGFNDDKTKFDLNTILENFGTVETGSTASQAYAAGDLLVYGSQLCKVSSSIAQGDALAVGTNIEEITVAAVSITPPNYELTETLWHETPNNPFTRTINVAKDGWYSLYVVKLTASSLTAALDVFVSIDINGAYQRLANITCSGDSLGAQTPWLYFKAGQTIVVGGTAQDAFFYYAPCM